MTKKKTYITAYQYAKNVDMTPAAICERCKKGDFKSAKKVGRTWQIDENEPLKLIKTGRPRHNK